MSRPIRTPARPTMGRRRFLRDLGVSAAAVPLLVGLDSLYAKAQVPTIPKARFSMIPRARCSRSLRAQESFWSSTACL